MGIRERIGRETQLSPEESEQELQDYGGRHPTEIRKLAKVMIGENFEGDHRKYRKLAAQVPVPELVPNRCFVMTPKKNKDQKPSRRLSSKLWFMKLRVNWEWFRGAGGSKRGDWKGRYLRDCGLVGRPTYSFR